MVIKLPINAGWMPDLSYKEIAEKGGLAIAKNIIPVSGNYLSVMDKATFCDIAPSGTPINGICVQDTNGEYYNFLGTSTKLYRFNKGNMTDITRTTGNYTASTWNFEQYGNWLIATDFSDDIQVLKGLTAANFQALGGSPPKAKFILMNNGYLIAANLNEGGVLKPKKIKWSGLENIETWAIDPAGTGADEQEFPDMIGNITGIGAIGKNFIIASEYSLTLGYHDPSGVYIFRFERNYVKNIGCFYPQSLISIGNALFFWSRDSIYMVDQSGAVREIGQNIKRTVFSDINVGNAFRITTAHDFRNGLVMWAYPMASSTYPNRILVYNYLEDRFTHVDIDCYALWIGAIGGISIDELTTTGVDGTYIPIDSNYWYNNQLQPMVADTADSKVKTASGNVLPVEVMTGEIMDTPNRLLARKAYVGIENAVGGSVVVKHRNSPLQSYSSSASSSVKSDGSVDLLTSNNRLAFDIQASGFTKLGNEIEIDIVKRGQA